MTGRLEAALVELAAAIREEVATPAVDMPDHLLSIDAAAAMLGIGRSATYGLVGAGTLRSCKVGRRRLIPASAIVEFIAQS